MIQSILLSFAMGFLGLALYFAWKAQAYLIAGKFDFKLWRLENSGRFIYASIFLCLIITVFNFVPESLEYIRSMFGLTLDITDGAPSDMSPLLLGLVVGTFVYRVNASTQKVQSLKNG